MKKIIATVAATAVLLTGCGQFVEESDSTNLGAEVQTSDFVVKNVSEINIFETGGEDGRINNWLISQNDDCNIVVLTDKTRKTSTYNISDEDFQALTHIDFSNYIGIKADTENIVDAIYYNIEIIYDNSTNDIIDVYIPELWHNLYEIISTYEPVNVELPEPRDTDTDSEPPFPESGTIDEYEYRIDNSEQGIAERGYYFDEETRPDSSLYVYISGGEYSSGGHGLYITNIEVKNGDFIITVKETSPEPDEAVTEAFEYPGCMVEISPKPEFVEIKNPNGSSFEYIAQAY